MKQLVHIFFVFFLSALIFYGGSGVNVFFFCCDDCQAKTFSIAVLFAGNKDCCCISQESATCGKDTCCQHALEDAYCRIDRIAFDWQSASDNQKPLQPLAIDLLDHSFSLSVYQAKVTTDALFSSHLLNRKSQHPPYLSKNEYFDLLCTLII